MTDRRIVYAAALLRALATGMIGVVLGVYLARLRFSPSEIGATVGAGLAGCAAGSLLATFAADAIGRRRILMVLAVVGAGGALAAATAASPITVGLASFVGMLNGMGRDRGAALILEQAILASTAADEARTSAFARYNLLQDAGHALGGLLAAAPAAFRQLGGLDELTSLRVMVALYAALVLATAALYPRLSAGVEAGEAAKSLRVSPRSRRILWKVSSLFALDSLAGGFLSTALLSFFFFERFGVGEAAIGALFFGARVLNALSHLAAAWLARRIGLVNTMVFTHVPSSLLLVTVAFAPSFPVAAVLFLLREGLVEMDVPTRQSYVMAVVAPEERTVASGVTHLVRLGGWATAPFFAGFVMQGMWLATPLILGAAIKLGYDALLFVSFRRITPPEERAARGVPAM